MTAYCWALLSVAYQAQIAEAAIYQVWTPADGSHEPIMVVVQADQVGLIHQPVADFGLLAEVLGYQVRPATEREMLGAAGLPRITIIESVTMGEPGDLPDGLVVEDLTGLVDLMEEEPGLPVDLHFRLEPMDWSELGCVWRPLYDKLETAALTEQRIDIEAGGEAAQQDFDGLVVPEGDPMLPVLNLVYGLPTTL